MDYKTLSEAQKDHLLSTISDIKSEAEKIEFTKEDIKRLLSYVDLTTLESTDYDSYVEEFSIKAKRLLDKTGIAMGAVCVYPQYAGIVKKALKDTGIATAVVSTCFPTGQTFPMVKILETELAVNAGADEIDMVIARGQFLSGNYDQVKGEIEAIKAKCHKAHLKVILETCDLKTLENIYLASQISIAAGGDFLKTSTGKGSEGATLEGFGIMAIAAKEEFDLNKNVIGLKAAGGIRTIQEAWMYEELTRRICGDDWCSPNRFRIGASSLVGNALKDLQLDWSEI